MKIIFASLLLTAGLALSQEESREEVELNWHTDLTSALEEAGKLQRPVFIFFSAEWCHWCHKMEDQTLKTAKAGTYLSREFVLVKADYDVDRELVAKYRVRGVPAMVVGDSKMKHVRQSSGFMALDIFMPWIEEAAATLSPAAITKANEAARQFVVDTSQSFRKGLTDRQYEAIEQFYEKCARKDPLSLAFAKNHLAEEVRHNPGRFCRFLKSEKLNVRIVTTNAFAKLYGKEFDYDPWDLSRENADRLDAFLEKKKISSLLEDLIDF